MWHSVNLLLAALSTTKNLQLISLSIEWMFVEIKISINHILAPKQLNWYILQNYFKGTNPKESVPKR